MGQLGAVGQHRAAVAVGAEVLARVEAGGGGQADGAAGLVEAAGAVRLGGVLEQEDLGAGDDAAQRLHRRHLAVEVHGDDAAGPAR